MQSPPVPVAESDSEEIVLERILSTLEQQGPMQMDEIVEKLHLYEHPAAEKILYMAMSDGMIQMRDQQAGTVAVTDFGYKVAHDIQMSMGVSKHGAGRR